MPRRPGLAPAEQLDHTPLPPVHLARDHPEADVKQLVRTGTWLPVRRGAYIAASLVDQSAQPDRYVAVARLAAVQRQLTVTHTVSHESAALLWGLPTLTVPKVSHIIQSPWPAGEHAADLTRHSHRLDPGDVTTHRGVLVTTLGRTALDCAMSSSTLAGLVVADACLHNGADRDACMAALAAMGGRHGIRRARAVLAVADDGAESPRETWTRYLLLRAGFPIPQTQVQVVTPLGVFWADIGWPEWRLLLEYDGRGKYQRAGTTTEVMVQERRRQDAVEEAGYRMVRVTKEDHRAPSVLIKRVARYVPRDVLDGLRPRRELSTLR